MHETLDDDLTAAEALFETLDDDLEAAEALLKTLNDDLEGLSSSFPELTPEDEDRVLALAPAPRTTATDTAYTGPSQRITIRIETNTLKRIKAAAEAKGLPYQTLINQLLYSAAV